MDDALFDYYEDREEDTNRLADEAEERQQEIDEEEEEADPARVCWLNLCDNEDRCKTMCGFSPEEFLTLYELIEDRIEENIGRGLRSKISKHDKLLMTLCYLKHYETIDKMKDTFSISKSHLHSLLQLTIEAITPNLYEYFVTHLPDRIEDYESEEDQLFPDAQVVMDATFQPIWTPTGTYNEKKQYFSGKHKMYGLKSQCIHDRKGRVVHCVPGEKGAIHDLTICRANLSALKQLLRKVNMNEEESESDEDTYGHVLVDSGYQGLQRVVKAILPYKKQPNRPFTRQQQRFNQELASERVICERFYGRLKTKFRIMSSKYRNSREEYQTIFRLCIALTNYHIIVHPL